MAEKTGGGWIKAILGMVGGLLSGAVVMYFSAWVDQAVKPAKPVANFRIEHEGYNVHFQNLSPGYQGWWDFGDGSELLPASAGQDSATHKYERPGDYTVKLSLSNLLGEENDRTVPLHIDGAPTAAQPRVISLTAERIGASDYAPVAYHITAKTENALLSILEPGVADKDQVVNDPSASVDCMVTYDRPGSHTIKLRVINGTATDFKTQVVTVQGAPAGAVQVALTAVESGTELKTRTQPLMFNETFRADVKGEVSPLSSREHFAASSEDRRKEWIIRDVQLKDSHGKEVRLGDKTEMPLDAAAFGAPNARNLRLQLSADRRSVHLVGELIRPSAGKVALLPTLMIQGTMTQEIRRPDARTVPMPAYLQLPTVGMATTQIVPLPALPTDWINPQPRKLSLAVWDAGKVAAGNMTIPGRMELTLQNRRCVLTATPVKDNENKDQIRLDLVLAQARASAK